MKKNLFFIFICIFIIRPIFSFPKNYTQKDLDADLKYYYKITSQKNMTANDKLYILNKIYEKYKKTNLNKTVLEKEIEIVKKQLDKTTERQQKNEELKNSTTSTQTILITQQTPQEKKIIDQETLINNQDSQDEKYKISSGDILYIRVFPTEDLSKEVIVGPDGKINFPLLGSIKADGITLKDLKDTLEKNLSIYITNPKVTITVRYFAKKQIFIMGEIRLPGAYQYTEGIKLFEFISQAGGLTPYAGTKTIKIYRGEKDKQKTISVNIDEIITDISKDILLEPGDIIEVPRQPKSISIIGSVVNPGNYEWQENMDLLKALSLAGGPSDIANLTTIRIFRENPDGTKQVIDVNGKKLFKGELKYNKKLQPGDVIYIPKKALVTGQWLVNTLLPWASLILSILIITTYIK